MARWIEYATQHATTHQVRVGDVDLTVVARGPKVSAYITESCREGPWCEFPDDFETPADAKAATITTLREWLSDTLIELNKLEPPDAK